MSTPTGDQGPPNIHQSVGNTADFQSLMHMMFGTFGFDTSLLQPDDGDDGDDTGQYFELDPDQARADMKKVQTVIDKATDLLYEYERTNIQFVAPADDDASGTQAKSSHDTIHAARKHLMGVIKYSINYHNKLARSIGDYDAIEQVNHSALGRAEGGGPSGTAV